MKKQIPVVIIILISFSVSSYAQKIDLGINASYNLHKIKGEAMQYTMEPGYSIGIYSKIALNKRFSIQPEIAFAQKAAKASTDFKTYFPESAYVYLKRSITLNYISVPLLVNYNVNPVLSLQFGPQYNYLVGSNENLTKSGEDAFRHQNIALAAGAQLQLGALKIYSRYTYGLNNINNINGVYPWKSRSIDVGVGWRLKFL